MVDKEMPILRVPGIKLLLLLRKESQLKKDGLSLN